MMFRRIALGVGAATLALSMSATIALAGNPSGTGQPGQSCGDFPTLTRPPGIVSLTNGFATTAVNVYANVTGTPKVSQYDVACFQVSQH
jgi:hypothetical protein